MVVSEGKPQKKSGVFRLDPDATERVQRMAFQASLSEHRRVTFAEILGRALDALERELAAGKPARKKG